MWRLYTCFRGPRRASALYQVSFSLDAVDYHRTYLKNSDVCLLSRFDSKRIVSGAYDGKIKVWDLQAALDPRAPAGTLCLRTLVVSSKWSQADNETCLQFPCLSSRFTFMSLSQEHTGRVFRLQFDEFQIVSNLINLKNLNCLSIFLSIYHMFYNFIKLL